MTAGQRSPARQRTTGRGKCAASDGDSGATLDISGTDHYRTHHRSAVL